MATETNDRVTVNIERETYSDFSKLAKLLGRPVKEAADEALREWNKKNAAAARRKLHQLLPAA